MIVSYEGVHSARDRSGKDLCVVGIRRHLDPHFAGVALDDFRRLYETLQEFSVLRLSCRAVYNKVILTPQGRTTYGAQCFAFEARIHYSATSRTFVPRCRDQDVGVEYHALRSWMPNETGENTKKETHCLQSIAPLKQGLQFPYPGPDHFDRSVDFSIPVGSA